MIPDPPLIDPDHLAHACFLLFVHPVAPSVTVEGAVRSESAKDSLRYRRIGYEFQHHHALEDAKAAGHVLLAAMAETGLDLEGVLQRVRQPIDPNSASSGSAVRRDGNPDGPLFGEVVVFTGALEIPRREAADLAAAIGCEVAQGVTKTTTLLVVGDVDVARLAGHEKSSKHRKAEELIGKGFPIRIIRETDFRKLVVTA